MMLRAHKTVSLLTSSMLVILLSATFAHADISLFTLDLHLGETMPAVRQLQVFLNTNGFVIATNGVGSPGNETDYFGRSTRAALLRFQRAHGLSATGFFGPLTRAAANAILAEVPAAAPSTSSSSSEPTIATVPAADSNASTSVSTSDPSWLMYFDTHAPNPSWTPGYGGGNGVAPSAPADTVPPTVSVTAPSGGSILAGTIALSANASDNVAVASVQFAIDGTATGTPIASAPYAFSWNSASVTDGAHSITAIARDAAGNQSTSNAISITTENSPPNISLITQAEAPDDTDMIISWTTDELADSEVIYGTMAGGPYTLASSTPGLTTSHSITLLNVNGSPYFFEIVSHNAAGVAATSSQQGFIILNTPPDIFSA